MFANWIILIFAAWRIEIEQTRTYEPDCADVHADLQLFEFLFGFKGLGGLYKAELGI